MNRRAALLRRQLLRLRGYRKMILGPLAPRILVLNGGCRGPWYVVTESKK